MRKTPNNIPLKNVSNSFYWSIEIENKIIVWNKNINKLIDEKKKNKIKRYNLIILVEVREKNNLFSQIKGVLVIPVYSQWEYKILIFSKISK